MKEGLESLAAGRLRETREELGEKFPEVRGFEFCARLSALYDEYFQKRLDEVDATGKPFALIAVGGYGRAELCRASDVDVLLVYESKIPKQAEALSKALFMPLWDQGVDVGHGVRTIADCRDLAKNDIEVRTSLMLTRLVAGSEEVFRKLRDKLDKFLVRTDDLLTHLRDMNLAREATTQDASGRQEPDLKSGPGGLRDYHQILWLGRAVHGAESVDGLLRAGLLTEAETFALRDEVDFVLTVRNGLHRLLKAKRDRLPLDFQPPLAAGLGFRDEEGRYGVENLMAKLHRDMSGIRTLREVVWDRVRSEPDRERPAPVCPGIVQAGGFLDFDLPGGYPDSAMVFLRIFQESLRLGLPLSWKARGVVSTYRYMVARALSSSPGAGQAFAALLASGKAAPVLLQMLETGFLGALIPEFGRNQDLIQFNTAHVFPVGRHHVEAVAILETATRDDAPVAREITDELEDARSLVLATLLHDVGKGLGGEHDSKGAELAADICRRWDLPDDLTAEVEFLVREHLNLMITATRRDLSDEDVVAAFAGRMGTPRRLKLLYVLTRADAMATGPQVWTSWTAALVRELYFKALNLLQLGLLSGAHQAQRVMATRDKVRQEGPGRLPPQELERLLDALPLRAALSLDSTTILEHMELVRSAEAKDSPELRWQNAGTDCARLLVAARHQERLFGILCGVLALHGANILDAEIFVWSCGISVFAFVLDRAHQPARLERTLHDAVSGRLPLEERLAHQRASPLARAPIPFPARVAVDNRSSDFYTLLSVSAPDRFGFLYDLAECLWRLGIVVHHAKAVTCQGRIQDTFFLRGATGQKLEGEDAERLITAVEEIFEE